MEHIAIFEGYVPKPPVDRWSARSQLPVFRSSPAHCQHARPKSVEAAEPRAIIHIVDTDPDFRRMLPPVFDRVGYEARFYSDFGAFVRADRFELPGCLLLDAASAPIPGPEAEGQLPALEIRRAFVVTSSHADIGTAVHAMKAGAVDFVEKPFREQRLLQAVAAAIRADRLRRSAQDARDLLRARFEALTRRERQVMALVTEGKLNKEIAWELGLSEITVKVHRGSMMRKMAARTLVDLVRMADTIAKPTGELSPVGPFAALGIPG